ncbi:MAG TPA: substrate-binding domain-containing protein [Casimicrobiaceae bacterium]|nr:substrate-binding domain-containing protein [Casimicrobiaceae bacterium]
MHLVPELSWRAVGGEGASLDERLLPLLEAIAATGSLSAAVTACGISYRAAWGLLRDHERALGTPFAQLERGRGAQLAPAGARLLRAKRRAERQLAQLLPRFAVELDASTAQGERLAVCASHDLALTALRDIAPEAAGIALDISFMGSLSALQQFAEGRASVAGFHIVRRGDAREIAPFRRWLNPRRDRLIRFVDREQGLLLPRGNPARVRSLKDIARKGLRFVNRQAGSGTRLLIERIAAREGIPPETLVGFAREEFTHAAVAATVASGAADVGFGLRAAAAEHGLAFVLAVRERYYLVTRAANVNTEPIRKLLQLLRGNEFARLVRALPGYAPRRSGTLAGIDALGER